MQYNLFLAICSYGCIIIANCLVTSLTLQYKEYESMWLISLLVLAIVFFLVKTAKDKQSFKGIGVLVFLILSSIILLGVFLFSY